jgi:hypothetical protein
MRYWSRPENQAPRTFLKADLLAAVQAMNTYLDGAASARPATSINAALPTAFRNAASTEDKGVVVAAITLAQTGNLTALRAAFGEVD